MKIFRAYKTELKLNNKQKTYFVKCAGAARFVYNWALADRIERYEREEKTNMFEQKRRFNALKSSQYPWLYEVPYTLQVEAFRNLDRAYQNFFRRIKNGDKPGFPKFKSRKNGLGNFSLRDNIYIEKNRIKLPRIGWVRLKEKGYLPFDSEVKLLKVTISERAYRWYISAQVEIKIDDLLPIKDKSVGVDVGVKNIAVISNGKVFDNPKALQKHEHKLKRLQRELARRKKGSNNRTKTKNKIAKVHAKIADIRKYQLHEISSYIFKTHPSVVVLEDLNVAGMVKNHHLAQAISDASMAELHRQIVYKGEWCGVDVFKIDRWYPSSKTCSKCGNIKDNLTLSDRMYKCETCGFKIDRDLNAAMNLAALGEPPNGRGLPVENEALAISIVDSETASVKQEAGSRC